MRDKNDKLTSQIKHKLQNYEVPAGDDLWARIENDLPDVKAAGRFRRYLYVLFGGNCRIPFPFY